jgi:Phytanoyl-CoA dioxygenase (PhyH)
VGTLAADFVAYLEPLTAASGALRLMPGSHHPGFSAAIDAWEARNRAMDAEHLWRQITGLPCYVAETQPGDVIAFNWHTRHASIGGKDRKQWTIGYAKDPQTAEEVERLRDFFGERRSRRRRVSDGCSPCCAAARPSSSSGLG